MTGRRLVGRRAELGRLVGDLSDKRSRIGVLLAGARRVGKTSLLLEAKRRLEARGIVVVYVSAWRPAIDRLDVFTGYLLCETIESFRGKIGLRAGASSLLAMRGGALADFLKGAKVTAEAAEGITHALSFARGDATGAAKAVSDAFMLPDRLAAQCGRRCVLIIDEFPSLADLKTDGKKAVGGSIMRAARTFNEEYGRTVLAISGSAPGTVRDAALSHSAPLYRQLWHGDRAVRERWGARIRLEIPAGHGSIWRRDRPTAWRVGGSAVQPTGDREGDWENWGGQA